MGWGIRIVAAGVVALATTSGHGQEAPIGGRSVAVDGLNRSIREMGQKYLSGERVLYQTPGALIERDDRTCPSSVAYDAQALSVATVGRLCPDCILDPVYSRSELVELLPNRTGGRPTGTYRLVRLSEATLNEGLVGIVNDLETTVRLHTAWGGNVDVELPPHRLQVLPAEGVGAQVVASYTDVLGTHTLDLAVGRINHLVIAPSRDRIAAVTR